MKIIKLDRKIIIIINYFIMKRKFGNLLMAATLVLAVGSFFTSCKDYDEELQAEMYAQVIDQINDELGTDVADLKETVDAILPTVQADINGLESVIAALEARVAELEALNHDHSNFATKEELAAAKAELEAAQAELDAAIKELADKMATKEALEEVATSLNDLKGEFATHVELFNALSNTVTEVLGRLSTLEGEYEALDARVKAIEDAKYQEQIDAIKGDLEKVVKQAAEADARSKANETAIEALEAYNVEFAQAVKDSVAALRAEAAANLAEAKAYADEAAAAVAAELAKTNATVAELQAAFAEAVAELQDQIDVLAEELDELKDDLAAIEEALGLLQDEVDDMRKDMNEQISGIVLNGAYSPVVGWIMTGVAAMTAFYMFRLYYGIFWGKENKELYAHHTPHEAPLTMTLPLVFLALVTLGAGFIPFGHFVSADGMSYDIHLDPKIAITSVVPIPSNSKLLIDFS